MNDLSTSKPSISQNIWSSLPWGTFLFLLAVFVFSTPFYRQTGVVLSLDDASATSTALQQDNWLRIIALFSLGVFALFSFLRDKPIRLQINGLLGWLILFYLVWVALSIIWSIDPRFTLKRVGIFFLLSLGALYVAERFSFQEIIALILFISAVAVLGGIVTELRTNTFAPFVSYWRFGGNIPYTLQAWHCGILLLSAIALAKTDEKNLAVYIGIAIIAFLFLILTRTRVSFISSIIGTAFYWGLTTPKRYQSVLLFLGIIIVGCSIYFWLGNILFIEFGEKTITLGRGEWALQTMQSFTGRIPLWNALKELIDQRPLVGYGFDSFLTGQNLNYITTKLNWASPNTHSGYYSTLGGLGYVGVVPLVLILILSVTISIRLAKRNSDFAFPAGVLLWLIINLSTEDQLLTRPYFPVFVWMIMLARLGFIREES